MWNAAVLLCKLPNYTFSSVTASHVLYSCQLRATATTSDDVSIPACEDEAHLAASTEKDEGSYGFAVEVPGILTVMAEVLISTQGVKINWILAPCLLEFF